MVSSADDTIFALSSGAGRAGVAVFRISGRSAAAAAKRLCGQDLTPRYATYTSFFNPIDGALIDKGLALYFKAPASFTGEDVVEVHLHGGRAVAEAFVGACLEGLKLRPAEAGEFTERAFRAGKLDLSEAEGLADLIDAETDAQRRQALRQMDGALSTLCEGWRSRLVAALAYLEAAIDFPDEDDIPGEIAAKSAPEIRALAEELQGFLDDDGRGERLREGVSVALLGAPNAGKSSLLNRLAGTEAAIVSETPGTTRDVVEVRLDLGGVPAMVADTAGLRDAPGDAVEAEGMRRAAARARDADIRILVLDGTASAPSAPDWLRPGDFIVRNKADLKAFTSSMESVEAVETLNVSAITGAGLEAFINALGAAVADRFGVSDAPLITRARHRAAAEAACDALRRAETALAAGPELAAEDVRLAARALGRISGRVDVEDVLGAIFSSFCVGK
ncbi:MAG: tRNA uridine-5-carboxymethylaminomethyl(34) synthesis GTPase MnmE [Pseudomonadota bacterium]